MKEEVVVVEKEEVEVVTKEVVVEEELVHTRKYQHSKLLVNHLMCRVFASVLQGS